MFQAGLLAHLEILASHPRKRPQMFLRAAIITGLVSTLLVESMQLGTAHPAVPQKPMYSCSVHCYAINDWPGGPINGSSTEISVVHLACNGNCQAGDFVNNEMWLSDQSSSGGPYWVEVGYAVDKQDDGSAPEQYFWADDRPGQGYQIHYLANVPAGDYGNYTWFKIQWQTDINSYCTSRYYPYCYDITVQSSNYSASPVELNNTMTPNDINIGEELSGYSGASAPTAYYIDNYWISTSNVGHYQTANGTITQYKPPYGGWTTYPSQSSTGGTLNTHCC